MEIIPPKNQDNSRAAYKKPEAPVPAAPASHAQPGASTGNSGPEESRFKGALSTIGLFASALLIAVLLNTFVIQSYQVDGESMENTLQNGDRLIVNKIPRTLARIDGHQYVPHRGDIIIFNEQGLPGFIGEKQLVKRVIGLPGDHVSTNGVQTTIYNPQHPNGFNPDASDGYHAKLGQSCGSADVYLKSNEIFVMGDNRGNSEDSRCFGPITTDQVVAKLVLRILPFNKTQSF